MITNPFPILPIPPIFPRFSMYDNRGIRSRWTQYFFVFVGGQDDEQPVQIDVWHNHFRYILRPGKALENPFAILPLPLPPIFFGFCVDDIRHKTISEVLITPHYSYVFVIIGNCGRQILQSDSHFRYVLIDDFRSIRTKFFVSGVINYVGLAIASEFFKSLFHRPENIN